jgi:predicted Zn-dependent protease with MMP-like domain
MSPMRLSFDEFERMVVETLDNLPEGILQHLENVDVVIEDWPSRNQLDEIEIDHGTLLGLYEGIPHIDRVSSYGLVLPDKITIFRGPVLDEARESGKSVEQVVRETVIHEIAHHFGISDERLIELDRY